jgi:NADPH:quinone reductase-like Zn-dependent oxidoreductase
MSVSCVRKTCFVRRRIVAALPGSPNGARVVSLAGEQLTAITRLVENGVIKPVVDEKYPLDAAPEALAYVESGRAAGKVVVEA